MHVPTVKLHMGRQKQALPPRRRKPPVGMRLQRVNMHAVEDAALARHGGPVLGDVAVVPDGRGGELERLGEEAPVQRRHGARQRCPELHHGAIGILGRVSRYLMDERGLADSPP